jgi:hypothetical protein
MQRKYRGKNVKTPLRLLEYLSYRDKEGAMFKVKATLVNFLGDENKYPCHFQHHIGDEVVFDGEKYIGRLCPAVWPLLVNTVDKLWVAGPRYVPHEFYYPYWFALESRRDESRKVYDGIGFINVPLEGQPPRYQMDTEKVKSGADWHPRPVQSKNMTIICPDERTLAIFNLQVFDLVSSGFAIPYFRRQMSILSRILHKQGLPLNMIMQEFTAEEINNIYPALNEEIILLLVEELEIMDYVQVRDGKIFVTDAGRNKLNEFKATLSHEEKDALRM